MVKNTKPTANIDDWTLVRDEGNNFVLIGKITNHDRQAEFSSQYQRTSKVVVYDIANNIAETENTLYTLGKQRADKA